ncbi:MAG: endonuclease domain-containing protein [Lactobacillales bacterium]|jgi:hypothetical protein|nr:endonuclease domain-containing protein [Lactobacillales bacterium]
MHEDLIAKNNCYALTTQSRKPIIFTGVSACLFLDIPIIDHFDYSVPRVLGKHSFHAICRSDVLYNERERINLGHEIICSNHLKTILELGKESSALGLVSAISNCLYRNLFSLEEIKNFVERNSRTHGMRSIKVVLPFVSTGDESPFETLVRIMIYLLGYEAPEQQLVFYDHHHIVDDVYLENPYGNRFVARVDMYYETRKGKIVFEVDGAGKGEKPGYYKRERKRQAALEQLGFKVVRLMYHEFQFGMLEDKLKTMGVRKLHNKPVKLPIINGLENNYSF